MKLQIVEASMCCIPTFDTTYKYILTLDDKGLVCCTDTNKKINDAVVCNALLHKMMEAGTTLYLNRAHLKNFKVEEAVRMGVNCRVLFEKEVSDMFLKGLYTESRLEEIKGDFND